MTQKTRLPPGSTRFVSLFSSPCWPTVLINITSCNDIKMLECVSGVSHNFKFQENAGQYVPEEFSDPLWIVLIEKVVIVAAHFVIFFVPLTAGEWVPKGNRDSGSEERSTERRACWESPGAWRSFLFLETVHKRFGLYVLKTSKHKGSWVGRPSL